MAVLCACFVMLCVVCGVCKVFGVTVDPVFRQDSSVTMCMQYPPCTHAGWREERGLQFVGFGFCYVYVSVCARISRTTNTPYTTLRSQHIQIRALVHAHHQHIAPQAIRTHAQRSPTLTYIAHSKQTPRNHAHFTPNTSITNIALFFLYVQIRNQIKASLPPVSIRLSGGTKGLLKGKLEVQLRATHANSAQSQAYTKNVICEILRVCVCSL
jgi:hypothetical protein